MLSPYEMFDGEIITIIIRLSVTITTAKILNLVTGIKFLKGKVLPTD